LIVLGIWAVVSQYFLLVQSLCMTHTPAHLGPLIIPHVREVAGDLVMQSQVVSVMHSLVNLGAYITYCYSVAVLRFFLNRTKSCICILHIGVSNHRACFGSSLLNCSVIVLRLKLIELPLDVMHSGGRLLSL